MTNIEPIQISPAATKANILSIKINYSPILSAIVLIGLHSEEANETTLLKSEQVELTEEEYLNWGTGEEADNQLLVICLGKLNIQLEA